MYRLEFFLSGIDFSLVATILKNTNKKLSQLDLRKEYDNHVLRKRLPTILRQIMQIYRDIDVKI